jgi:putative hydrolase of the HAD superfamily
MQIDFNSDTVVVFDLDDTLYAESDYRKSGIIHLMDFVTRLYGQNTYQSSLAINDLIASDDFIARIADTYKLPRAIKDSLLWIYRTHRPSIKIRPDVQKVIVSLEMICKSLVILTDGRSVTQRLKIEALGLTRLPAYISEEFSSEKPSTERFLKIANRFECDNYVYIADNPQKDFLAPNSLGWRTIGLRGDQTNIHSQNVDGLAEEYLPNIWIDSLSDLLII